MLQINTGTHSQSGKEVAKIVILGRSFIYSDKRGMSMHAEIDANFVREIIETIPSKVLLSEKLSLLDNPSHEFVLSWLCYGVNKSEKAAGMKETYELRIHFGANKGSHIYTSINLTAE